MSLWVSLEGSNGVGKTHFARRLARRFGDDCTLLEEISDLRGDDLTPDLVGALAAGGDPFLRGPAPRARTLTLLALKARAYERADRHTRPHPHVVLEDRGVDTVAAYQAAILAGMEATDAALEAEMNRIYATATPMRPLPDLTLLIVDDPVECARRYALRTGLPMIDSELALSACATRLYQLRAAREPDRFHLIDRWGLTQDGVLAAMEKAITDAMYREETVPCSET